MFTSDESSEYSLEFFLLERMSKVLIRQIHRLRSDAKVYLALSSDVKGEVSDRLQQLYDDKIIQIYYFIL